MHLQSGDERHRLSLTAARVQSKDDRIFLAKGRGLVRSQAQNLS
jgi:hypothetical protein